jgi:hypothetical protein
MREDVPACARSYLFGAEHIDFGGFAAKKFALRIHGRADRTALPVLRAFIGSR